jgi:hypothetical protein
MADGDKSNRGVTPSHRVDEAGLPISGSGSATAYRSGMSAEASRFADHLLTRCEQIGLPGLAEALDRLEAPLEGEVKETGTGGARSRTITRSAAEPEERVA